MLIHKQEYLKAQIKNIPTPGIPLGMKVNAGYAKIWGQRYYSISHYSNLRTKF